MGYSHKHIGVTLSAAKQASLKVFCACELRSEKNVPAEELECNRWSYTDLDEKNLQKCDVWHSVPASGNHRSCRLMSPAAKGVYNVCPIYTPD